MKCRHESHGGVMPAWRRRTKKISLGVLAAILYTAALSAAVTVRSTKGHDRSHAASGPQCWIRKIRNSRVMMEFEGGEGEIEGAEGKIEGGEGI